jgi:hypothetical protein
LAAAEYITEFRRDIFRSLHESLVQIIDDRKVWSSNDLGLPLTYLSEFLHHSQIAVDKCSDYIGRESLVKRAVDFIFSVKFHEGI